ncbi:MAG: hypothetical protein JSS10_03190 [Verrucomicrobia bacterium]|nr:hypothetical protein [Verrucomicrobiota bacterium]
MTSYAAYLVPRPIRDILRFDRQSADAAFFALSRVTLAGLVVFAGMAFDEWTQKRFSLLAQRNILICAGVCLSLPATILSASLAGMWVGVSHLTQKVAHRNFLKGAGLIVASYASLELHDRFKWGLCEPLLQWSFKAGVASSRAVFEFFQRITPSPIRKRLSHISAVVSWNLPPQPLKDVNPFNVRTQEDAERVVLAAQRIAAGALIAFLALRYTPIKRTPGNFLLAIGSIAGCMSLSIPACLIGGSVFFSFGLVETVRKKNWTLSCIILVGTYQTFESMPAYKEKIGATPFMPHWFNRIFQSSPNLLDKLFVIVAKKCSGVVFRALARKN